MFDVKKYNSITERENKTNDFWKKNDTFKKSIEERPEDDRYSFLDGPPFVTGLPHYAQLLPRIAKDLIPRYMTMKGKRVRRVWGWDCHGLPIEERVEKKLGLKNRREIESFGINKFLVECANYVDSVTSEWEWYMDKIGSWCDMENAYRTMDKDYMESVIWVFKQLYDKDLIYEGAKTLLFCTRCGTPVSKFEIAMDDSYTDVEDPTITVEFPVTTEGEFNGSRILAWTTTPWTMPSNRALVVDPDDTYVEFTEGDQDRKYIVAKKLFDTVARTEDRNVLRKFKGNELVGLAYEPPYTFIPGNKNDFKVYAYDGMVNMSEGTGIVHSAPGFGEIDTEMGQHYGLTIMYTVDDEGNFIDEIKDFKGRYVKEADPDIIKDLKDKDVLYHTGKITHRYPFCYRCQTPLIQKSLKSWFVRISDIKDFLIDQNKKINWVPEKFKYGRFEYTIQTAPDWGISRTRYWATAMPVWKCDSCDEQEVFGSIKELEERSGEKIEGLHRNDVDHIEFPCKKCKGTMKRIPEVLDCWMESGSMPVGQVHYPFENKELFDQTFPADYIIEYVGQIRAWFYYMHVVANAVFKKNSFKNVVVSGVMAGEDGRKMSKSFGNFPDPKETLEKYGGDAIRLYLMSSPIMAGEDMNFSEEDLRNQVLTIINPLWNSLTYFSIYANTFGWEPGGYKEAPESVDPLDRWILARLATFQKEMEDGLGKYFIPEAVRTISPFLEDLSTWYIRRSRERFVEGDTEALGTLYFVLAQTSLIIAPAAPFLAEELYQVLVAGRSDEAHGSVHLDFFPEQRDITAEDQELLETMSYVRDLASAGLAIRDAERIRLRQPLSELRYTGKKLDKTLEEVLKDELNVQAVKMVKTLPKGEAWKVQDLKNASVALSTEIDGSLKKEGLYRDLLRKIQSERKKAGLKVGEMVDVVVVTKDDDMADVTTSRKDDIIDAVAASSLEVRERSGESTKKRIFVTM
jgi:isoleucyl-tRNA synthetase